MRAPEPSGSCWSNGRIVPLAEASLAVDDPGLLGGLGLFETLAVRDGTALDLSEHLERLYGGAVRLGLELPPREDLERAVRERAAATARCGWLKIVATRGGRQLVFGGPMDPDEEGRPGTAVLLPWRRSLRDPLAGLKTLSYAANLLGQEEARRRGADEGIWLNARGHLAEGCTSNLFVVDRGKLYTPGRGEGILPGVVRAVTLRAAERLGITVHEGKIRLRRLEHGDEAFLTSSLRGIRPLLGLGRRIVGRGEPGPLTRRLAEEVRRLRAPVASR